MKLVEQYKQLLTDLVAARRSETPPSHVREAELAERREEIWHRIPHDERIKLDTWIAQQMKSA